MVQTVLIKTKLLMGIMPPNVVNTYRHRRFTLNLGQATGIKEGAAAVEMTRRIILNEL